MEVSEGFEGVVARVDRASGGVVSALSVYVL